MQRQAQPADVDLHAFSRGIRNASQGEIADALDGHAGSDAHDGEQNERRDIEQQNAHQNGGGADEEHPPLSGEGGQGLFHAAHSMLIIRGNGVSVFISIRMCTFSFSDRFPINGTQS